LQLTDRKHGLGWPYSRDGLVWANGQHRLAWADDRNWSITNTSWDDGRHGQIKPARVDDRHKLAWVDD